MSDKFVTFNEGRSTPTGLPQAVDTKINTRYATKAELQSAVIGTGGVVSSSVARIVATTDPEYVPQPGELVLEYEPPFIAVADFTTGIDDWTPRWRTDVTWSVEDNPGALDGKTLRVDMVPFRRTLLSWDVADNAENAEILYRARIKDLSTTSQAGGSIRASGETGSETAYRVSLFEGKVAIAKFVDGAYSNLRSPVPIAGGVAAGDWVWVRFRVFGTQVSASAWLDTVAEPTSWMVEATDSTITGPGWVGVGTAMNSEWSAFAVALDGASAVIP